MFMFCTTPTDNARMNGTKLCAKCEFYHIFYRLLYYYFEISKIPIIQLWSRIVRTFLLFIYNTNYFSLTSSSRTLLYFISLYFFYLIEQYRGWCGHSDFC